MAASDATFRIVVSPTPIVGPDRTNKRDNHANAGFSHEGNQVRNFLASLDNTFVICGDRHWQYVSKDPATGLTEFSCGPTSDKHAGGFGEKNRSDMHEYLKICGGFLNVAIELEGDGPRLALRHYGANGDLLNEVLRTAQ
jgi:alkaline phosphatase D